MKKILISGKQYPLHLGLNAIRLYCRAKKIEFHQFQEQFSFESKDVAGFSFTIEQLENIALLVQCGIENGARKEKMKMEIPSVDDIIEIFENPDEVTRFFEAFSESVPEAEKKEGTGEPEKNVNSLEGSSPSGG
jgi:hypothetical protein